MAFDGIVTKAIVNELQTLNGAKIDKVFQPDKNTIILGLYNNYQNFALNICIDAQNCRINLTTHPKTNPKVAPNFCMFLRKHLIGCRIKDISTFDLERIITINLETLGEFRKIENRKLIIELMGKHSNIILVDENNIIMDSIRHTNQLSNSYRDIFPGKLYVLPKSEKHSFINLNNFDEFFAIINSDINSITLPKIISNNFNGISMSFINNLIKKFNISNLKNDLEKLYLYIKDILNNIKTQKLSFENILNDNNEVKDYALILTDEINGQYTLNFYVDDYYYNKETKEQFITFRNSLLKLILDTLKKYNKKLLILNEKIEECNNMNTYKLYGELLTANLYKLEKQNLDKVTLENYYDDNNLIDIPLDSKYNPNTNAKRYFKKYNKLKTALDIVKTQKEETQRDLNYLESLVYSLESAKEITDLQNIFEEISESNLFKLQLARKLKKAKNKNSKQQKQHFTFNPIKINIDEYSVYIGRNNKENDYITTKLARKNDIWFHTKDIHGSHVVLKIEDNKLIVPDEVIYECAQIAAYHSKAKNSSNVPVDYARIGFVKKPNGSKPGMVIYSNNKTLYVNPKKEN